jgi:hypothetical protein
LGAQFGQHGVDLVGGISVGLQQLLAQLVQPWGNVLTSGCGLGQLLEELPGGLGCRSLGGRCG